MSNMASRNELTQNDSLGKELARQFLGDKFFDKILENMVGDSLGPSMIISPEIVGVN